MSVADKLVTIADNMKKVYNAGDTYINGFEDGKNSVVDNLRYVGQCSFQSLNVFGKAEVELNLNKCTSLLYLCFVNNIENINNTVEHITINIPEETATTITNASGMLGCSYSCQDTVLKKVTINFPTNSIQNFSNMLDCLTALEEIDGIPLDFSSATTIVNPFNYHNSLKEVRFVETSIPLSISFSYSSQLSTDTIQSIIDGLATVETPQELNFHANVVLKLTDEQILQITNKNWSVS